jgi:hypothetical protein
MEHSGLVGTTDAEGKSIFAGKAFTGFSNEEEEIVGKVKVSLGGLSHIVQSTAIYRTSRSYSRPSYRV